MKANTNYFYTSVIQNMEEIKTEREKEKSAKDQKFNPAVQVMEGSKSMIKNV